MPQFPPRRPPYCVRRWVRINGRKQEPLLLVVADSVEPDGLAYRRISDYEHRDGRVVALGALVRRPSFRIFTRCAATGYMRRPPERRAAQLGEDEERRLITEHLVAQLERAEPWAPKRTDAV
jgi:hypothetical protein